MNYSQSANPNATNSELDAKIIITHKQPDLGEESVNNDDELDDNITAQTTWQ